VVSDSYGLLTSLALDPIEKKPLNHFHPGSHILSFGSFGCNLNCPFCQNSHISMAGLSDVGPGRKMQPERLVEAALAEKKHGNIGLAYTYNEPLVGYEYTMDCAKLSAEAGLCNVLVTNGYICPEPLSALLPYIHALNIDLKGFREEYYRKLGGDLKTVKETITMASESCHIEVTTLIVPGENDSEEEMRELAGWLASVNPDIPYHVSRFFPRWKMADKKPTPVKKIYELADTARQYLRYVYEGNC
jgi:pyruvate formate lyase activating enzyme